MIKNTKDMLNFFNLYKEPEIIEKLSKEIKQYIYHQQKSSIQIIQFIEKKL